jgi:hypothetical protein
MAGIDDERHGDDPLLGSGSRLTVDASFGKIRELASTGVDAALMPNRRTSDVVVPQAATTRPDGPTDYLLAMGVLDAARRGAP